jgi:hypothetical protein
MAMKEIHISIVKFLIDDIKKLIRSGAGERRG